MLKVSVIIPVYNEEAYIDGCLSSVYAQDYPRAYVEVIVVDGGSQDRSVQIIKEKYPEVIILHNSLKIVPVSMNIGIGVANGDYIMRMDAHAYYSNNYISRLISEAERLGADNVGGICRTLPADDTPMSRAIAIALSTKFGMGNSDFRVGATEVKQVDTVPFGCFPRQVFERVGLYDEELVRNQDDELNGRITRSGGKIYLIPDVVIGYYGRRRLRQVYEMFYQYGLFKPLGNSKLRGATTLRQFVPFVFVLVLLLGAIGVVIYPRLYPLYFLVIGLYLFADLLATWKNSSGFQETFLRLALLYPTIHIAYGWGYLVGVFKIMCKLPFGAEINR